MGNYLERDKVHETIKIIDMTEKEYAEYVQDEIRKQIKLQRKKG